MWRDLLDGRNALNFVLMAAAYRVEDQQAPPSSVMLSPGSEQLHIQKLPEEGVSELINACFHDSLDKSHNLTSFLFAETGGSPLYLRSLLSTLVSRSECGGFTTCLTCVGPGAHHIFRL